MRKVAIVGWRGMVGSVLMERLRQENDFGRFEPVFCSTSQVGQNGPEIDGKIYRLADGNDPKVLAETDLIVTCQGGTYTENMQPKLRQLGWQGLWIDAASTLRMDDSAVIVLDPVNRHVIDRALEDGVKNFIGGNCTVSLMLMALGGLYRQGWVEWISSQTYQAASGAGAKNMRELVEQMAAIARASATVRANPAAGILELDREVIAETMERAICHKSMRLVYRHMPRYSPAIQKNAILKPTAAGKRENIWRKKASGMSNSKRRPYASNKAKLNSPASDRSITARLPYRERFIPPPHRAGRLAVPGPQLRRSGSCRRG